MDTKKQAGFAQVIIIILVLVLVGGAYYFGTLKNKPNLSPVVPSSSPITYVQPTLKPTVIPTIDLTNNWKTYTGVDNTYSFKYPSLYKLTPYNEGSSQGIMISNTTNGASLTDGVMIKTLVVTNVTSAKTFAQEQWQSEQNQPDFSTTGTITQVTPVSFGSKTGYTYEVSFRGNVKVITVPLTDTSVLRVAGYYAGADNKIASYKATLDQILSTFKFTD